MKKKEKWILSAFIVAFLLLQFSNPARTNPPAKNNFPIANAPSHVAAMLRASCYDCHSDETRWPWYSHIAPLSWQIAQDVNDGREQLNLSEWPDDPMREARRLEDMSEQIEDAEMPLKKYTFIHRAAQLTQSDRLELQNWLDAEAMRLKSSTAK
jgi:hypothetical protein